MLVALIAALATVIVALVGLFASRMESRDARSRLVMDLEILSKLESGSVAWRVMDSHIARVTDGLVERERRIDDHRSARRMVYFGVLSSIVVLGLSIVREHNLRYYEPLIRVSYWMFFVYMVLFPVLAVILFVRVERKRWLLPTGKRRKTKLSRLGPEQAK